MSLTKNRRAFSDYLMEFLRKEWERESLMIMG